MKGPLRPAAFAAIAALTGSLPTAARAQDTTASSLGNGVAAVPPPSGHAYVQYGVALAAETVISSGAICSLVPNNCVFGLGGGLAVRVGWRPNDELYVGGVYEVSKQDPNQLYPLGILQQVRAEGRRYFLTGREVTPFLLVGAGVAGYGNEWSVDTWGPTGTVGGGIEVGLGGPVLLVSAAYRPMYFRSWVIPTDNQLQSGIVHFVGLDVAVEAKDRL